jgi:hypothetical protein
LASASSVTAGFVLSNIPPLFSEASLLVPFSCRLGFFSLWVLDLWCLLGSPSWSQSCDWIRPRRLLREFLVLCSRCDFYGSNDRDIYTHLV